MKKIKSKNITIKQRIEALKNIPALFLMIHKSSPLLFWLNILLRIVKSGIPVGLLYFGKLIIDQIVILSQNTDESAELVWWYLSAEFGLAILSDIISRTITLTGTLLGDKFANDISVRLIEHASKLDLAQFEDPETYDKLERARRQTLARTRLMTQILNQFQGLVTMLSLAIGLITFNWWLLVLLTLTIIPSFIGEMYFNKKSYSLITSWTPQKRILDYLRFIGASDETAKEIKLFGLSEYITQKFKYLSDKYYDENKKLNLSHSFWTTILMVFGTIGYYGAYLFIIRQTVNGQLSLGDLTFLAGAFLQLRRLLDSVLSELASVTESALYLKDLFDFFEIKPTIICPKNPREFPNPIRQGFEFVDVGFRYPNSAIWANRHLNFKLRPHEKLALVGENGAGKTTLVKLLARLYDPSEGQILLDGYDLKEYEPEKVQKYIGVIFQDYVRFQMTARENIAVGNITELDNFTKIEAAAKQGLANIVIENLPKKYEQILGKRFDSGTELSGGQWQKIAISRAYMRDAQVLILDEPTSALDARAEHEVFLRFSELTRGKSAVLISHRFSTVRMADRILVLEQGQITEIGTHEELLQQNGKYAELFYLQAKGYH